MLMDPDLEIRVKKATERISENMHIVANEPSLAFYRLQEHVRKALNPIVDRRSDVLKLHQELQGRCYDVDAIKAMNKADTSFKNTLDHIKNAIFVKQQLKYEESRKKKPEPNSVYKRLSAHITLDLTELSELSDVVRETANRVESMMSKAAHSSS
ncbi:BLOC-1-related complex subunit 8 homolog isoform X2 [Agrilus planipennis]|uniref:BLOC-1-related complex subunit 8 homolog isoform X2 n=1 Tax=Agrilus planipennis TaxID=224129 RepID=A0A1W4XMQ5_AGRPL|nr:BLOC-1-related complex subunit 8 homolog isoform X2 [Agrilus planipennis]XP_025834585.1 BLOC-1-related complex subunit 8 homolog isoform X2 [Agrilus planipennis]